MQTNRKETISKLYKQMQEIALPNMLNFQSDLEYDLVNLNNTEANILIWGYRQTGTNLFDLTPSCKHGALERITHPQHNTGTMLKMHWHKVDMQRGTIEHIETSEAIYLYSQLPEPRYTIKTKNSYIKQFSQWPEVYQEYQEVRKIDPDCFILEENNQERCTA